MVDNRFHYFLFFPHFLGFQQQNRSFPEQSVQFDCVSFLNYIQHLFFFCSIPPLHQVPSLNAGILSLVCSCWTRIKANLRWSRQNVCWLPLCFSQVVSIMQIIPNKSHARTLPNLRVCFYRIVTHFSLCSNTLSSLQDSSTELFPVTSTCTLQVSMLFLCNQFKNSLIQNESTSCLETIPAPRKEQDAFPAFPGAPSTSRYVCTPRLTLPQRLFPALQLRCDGEEHMQHIYKKFELLLRTVIHWPPCCHKGKCSQHSDKRGKSQVP